MQEIVDKLLAEFALLRPVASVRAVFGASDELAGQILEGTPIDLFLSANSACVESLVAAGLADAEQCRVLAQNGLAALSPLRQLVGLARRQDLLRSDVGRVVLARPECPLGQCTQAYRTLGVYDRLLPSCSLWKLAGRRDAAAGGQGGCRTDLRLRSRDRGRPDRGLQDSPGQGPFRLRGGTAEAGGGQRRRYGLAGFPG